MNIAAWLARAGRSYGDQPAIALGSSVVLTYSQLAARCGRLASALRSRYGVGPGDRVAVVAKNHPAYLEALFGIWWAGLVAVPINAKLHAGEIRWIIEHSDASLAFVSEDVRAALGALASPTQPADVVALGSETYESLVKHEPAALEQRDGEDLAWLFYTSGTTGRPKGAMLSHRNLIAMSLAYLADVDHTAPGDAVLHVAPMSHGSGLYGIPHVARAAVNVVPESGGFDASEALALIRRWPGTSIFAPPTIVKRMVECQDDLDERSLRTIIWGGAPMHVSDILRALERFGPRLAQIYGQGETPMSISVLSKHDVADRSQPRWHERLGSAGIVNCAVEVRIADLDDRELQVGELGEILVRGETVMSGYWRDAEASATALRGGWLHTGDIGAFDADGYLTLRDRSKDLIISGGSNVYPREVEEILASHPAVDEVSVIGRPDPEWGEVVVAYVVGEVDRGDLNRLCLERIARFKRPRDYVFLNALPKNNYGKVLKTELRRLDAGRGAPSHSGELVNGATR